MLQQRCIGKKGQCSLDFNVPDRQVLSKAPAAAVHVEATIQVVNNLIKVEKETPLTLVARSSRKSLPSIQCSCSPVAKTI
jgi:hypothetical protein